jgi:hypothetical protein
MTDTPTGPRTKAIKVSPAVLQHTKIKAAEKGISIGEYTERALRLYAGGPGR